MLKAAAKFLNEMINRGNIYTVIFMVRLAICGDCFGRGEIKLSEVGLTASQWATSQWET